MNKLEMQLEGHCLTYSMCSHIFPIKWDTADQALTRRSHLAEEEWLLSLVGFLFIIRMKVWAYPLIILIVKIENVFCRKNLGFFPPLLNNSPSLGTYDIKFLSLINFFVAFLLHSLFNLTSNIFN